MSEISIYQNNLQTFLNTLEGSLIEKLVFEEDLSPTFDKASLPFEFNYCHSVIFVTNKGNFLLHTSATSFGYETFWTQSIESINEFTSEKIINSNVKSTASEKNSDGLPYKLSITLEKGILLFYAADIYYEKGATHSIKMNDEMVLVFDDKFDAMKFEAVKNYP
jgi:hypothetical protein